MRSININPEQIRRRLESDIYNEREQSGNVTQKQNSGEVVTIIYEKPHANPVLGKLTQFLKKISATFKSMLHSTVSSSMNTQANQDKALRNINSTPAHFRPVISSGYEIVGEKGGHKKLSNFNNWDKA